MIENAYALLIGREGGSTEIVSVRTGLLLRERGGEDGLLLRAAEGGEERDGPLLPLLTGAVVPGAVGEEPLPV